MDSTPHPSLDWSSANLKSAWKRFRQHCELMFSGPLEGKSQAVQCSYLLIWVGDKGRDIFSTWTLTDAETNRVQTYLNKFGAHVEPISNPIVTRFTFHKRDQGNESIEQYVTDLKLIANDCDFGTSRDYLIRDRLVFGVKSDRIREKLLSEGGTLTLARAIETCRAIESVQETQAQMTAANKTSVPAMKQEIDALKKQYNNKECYFCGAPYTKNHNCPARGKTCSKCNKLNHFAKVCKSKVVNEISQQEARTSASEFMIDTVNSMLVKHADGPDAVIRIVDQKLDLVFKIDTGAEANVLPVSDYNSMVPKPRLQPTKDILTSYSGERLQVLGFVELCICYKECEKQVHQFHVVNTDRKPILSRKTSQKMNLIKFILNVQSEPAPTMKPETARILEEYGDVFEGVGKLPGKCKIHLKEGAVPTVQPPKRVPFALQEKLKEELERLEVMGIIEKTTTPTEWVNSIVVVQKPNGSLRICLDPVDLNKWVQRPYHPIPSFDDVAAKCSGSNTFFKLDARQGYWSMELDEESSLLTTFSTTFGRYRWKRYPFGVKSAQDEFQRKMEEVFEGLDIGLIIDDIAGTAANTEDHDAKLRLVLQRAREKGVRFNRDKCIFNAASIPYFGHLLTTEGIKADPEKTNAIANMPAPESHEQLQVLLGMYNYLARYIPNLSTLNHPLRELSKSKTYDWTTQHENARKQIQASICKNLSYFDHKSRNVEVIVDASQHGLGAQLVVDSKTVAFGSRSLSGAEKRYSQIEKEMLAVTYACKHFRQYIYGRTATVTTDHKPLESILKKPISKAPPRLQRMMIAVQNYDIQVIYRPGSEIPVADALSRLHLPETDPDTQQDSEFAVLSFLRSVPIRDNKIKQIIEQTKIDQNLQVLVKTIAEGWPDHRHECNTAILKFWNHRDELTYMDGVILKGDRIIIPETLQNDILNQLHASHLGMVKTKERARMVVFWPNITKDIENMIGSCSTCCTMAQNQVKESMMTSRIPTHPYEHVGTDIFEFMGVQYLVTADYYSRFIEVDKLTTSTSQQVITKLKAHFARHGIPKTLTSDNGTQFSSKEFRDFVDKWSIDHKTSSPNYPQSNGFSEKAVQTAKRIMSKAVEHQSDPYLAMLEYRNTPVDGLASPAQLLMSRQLRSVLPVLPRHLDSKVIPPSSFQQARERQQKLQTESYNRHSKDLKPLLKDQTVWVKLDHNARWQKALILEKYEYAPRSYILQTENGKVYRRNRRQIRERNQGMPTEPHYEATSPEPSMPGDQPHVSPRAQIGIEHPHSVPSSPTNFPTPPRATTTPAERFATPLADAATAESPSRSPSHLTQRPRQPLRGTTRSGRITKPPTRLNL